MSKIDADHPPAAVIFGLAGKKLSAAEKAFITKTDPLGFILFARNCDNPAQVKKLVESLRDTAGRAVPVLIDQEGGRVQRLGPPHWDSYPAAKSFESAFLRNFAKGRSALLESAEKMAGDLAALGINVNCAPVLDVLCADTHEAIGDRAFSQDPQVVAALGAIMARGLLNKGVIPVMKHLPGQGRAQSDSHKDLPVVDTKLAQLRERDFLPFQELLGKIFSEAIWGMVAHVVYKDIDEAAPASASRRMICDVIREDIGFTGFLLSDDICMGALDIYGDAPARAEKIMRAGCDAVLHCSGDLDEMKAVAARIGPLGARAVKRYNQSVAWVARNR